MKKHFLLFFLFFYSIVIYSQSPQGFNYQAIVRDYEGNIKSNTGVQFIFNIQTANGVSVYSEIHTVITNKYGLIDLVIGKGITSEDFSNINWSSTTYMLNVTLDGVDLGATQLMSVPYALYAVSSGSSSGGGGVGISSTVDNGDGTFTLNYTDGTSFTTTNLSGKSAYQLWIDKGNSGTEEDFLASLEPVTLENTKFLSLNGQEIVGKTVPIIAGGTGAITASAARSNLGVDVAGTDNSTEVTLGGTSTYLTINGQQIIRGKVNLSNSVMGTLPISNGGTGGTTAEEARTALGLEGLENSDPVTLENTNYLSLNGQEIVGKTVPIIAGGTGAITASAARTNLGVDIAGTDNSTEVTLGGTSTYLTLNGQEIIRGKVNLSNSVTGNLPISSLSGTLPISQGGTGGTTVEEAKTALGLESAIPITLENTNYLSLNGQELKGKTVPLIAGGTGAITASAARTNLGIDIAGTDNSTNVTLGGTSTYLTLNGQEIIRGKVNLSNSVIGTLPISKGGTGSSSAEDARVALGVDAETARAISAESANSEAIALNTAKETNVTTDLSTTTSTTTLTVVSSDGNDAVIPVATTSAGGVMSAALFDEVAANTSKSGITSAQADAITANTAKVGITTAQADAITVNTAKTGITLAQADAITTNTSKIGITSTQANAILANTDKETNVTSNLSTEVTTTTLTVKSSDGTDAVLPVAKSNAGGVMSAALFSEVAANTAKTGITSAQATTIANLGTISTQDADAVNIDGGAIDGVTIGTNGVVTQAVIDNINIDGATIGHTGDTDLLTLASGIVTVAGEVSLTTLDIGGTNVTADASELNYVDGVTSSIQTQLNAKSATISGAATTIASSDLTASRAVVSNGSGKVAVSDITSTELGYLDGVTSSIQTQLNAKSATISGAATTIASSDLTASRAVVSNGSGKVAVSDITSTELGYLDGVTSSIQTQLNAKSATISGAATTIASSDLTASRAVVSNGSGKVAVSDITSTELGYLDGVTSSIQTQLDAKGTNVTTDLSTTTSSTTLTVASSDGDDAVLPVATTSAGGVMSAALFDAVTANTAKTGITSAQATTIANLGTISTQDANAVNIDGGAIDGVTIGTNGVVTQAVIDNINIDGATIGHTGDTDLLTLASGIVTVAGEVSLTTLDIGGTNVTADAGELNIMDGSATQATVTLAGTDGIVISDGNVMKQALVSDIATYVSSSANAATATTATNVTITDNESTNENNAIVFSSAGDLDGGNMGLESDGNLNYNPSSGTLTTTTFVGNITGNVAGNASGTAATVTSAAQSNITSLGTLTTLTVDNVIINGSTIGHTGDTDLLTLSSGIVTVAGEVSLTTLDIGGTNVTADASELNYVDGVTSSIQTQLDAKGTASNVTGLSDALIETNSMYIGHDPVSTTSTAQGNVSVGTTALDAITTGDWNTAIGDHALSANNTGYVNTAIGAYALSANTEGYANTAIGEEALENTTTGDWNTAIGVQALEANVSGSGNTAIGEEALQANTASYNTAIGLQALEANVSGAGNTAIGSEALQANTSNYNTAIGTEALTANTTGTRNIAIGYAAYDAADAEDDNLAIGYNALGGSIDGGEDNVAVGNYTLSTLTTGDYNTAIGKDALKMATTGYNNTATGDRSLHSVTTGYHNTALGSLSGYGITEGYSNVSVGSGANQNTTTGNYNVAIGQSALVYNQTGNSNTAIGKGALEGASSQSLGGNTALGYGAGNTLQTGNYNTIIGYNSDASASGSTNQIVIGYNAVGTTDNTVLLGNASITAVHMSQDGQATVYTGGLVLEGATANAHETTLGVVDPTADATLNLPAMGAGTYYVPVLAAASTTSITSTPAELNIMDGVTSTAAELNIMDGVTSTAAELNIMDGVTSTAAELNIMDGGTSATSTTIADADRVVLNDNGTMVQVAVTDLSTYIGAATSIDGLSDAKLAGANFTGGLSIGHAMTAATLATATYNTAIGVTALDALTEGDWNTAIGEDALTSLTTGQWNTAVGYKAGKDGASLFRNTFIGYEAGAYGGSNYNVGVGYRALKSASGEFNTGVGMESLSGSSGASNTGVGAYSLADGSLSGSSNTAVGLSSLRNNEGGASNTAVGMEAAKDNTSGNENVAIGSNSLSANLTGNRNIAIGYQALDAADAEHDNLAIGHGALGGAIAGGEFNIAIGNYTLDANTSGDNNVAVGYNALGANTTGTKNIAIGYNAYDNADTESNNIAIGYDALGAAINGGEYNVALGNYSLDANTTGDYNVAVGDNALGANTTGTKNIVIGSGALYANTTGNNNTASGYTALLSNTTGTNNTALGYQAGDVITTGDYNVIIGSNSDPSGVDAQNQIVIGHGVTGIGDNYAVIGNADVTRVYAAQDGAAVLYADATIVSSDERLKENIKSITHGLDFIKKLNPVSYDKMHVGDFLNNQTPNELKFEIGLLAQEVKKASESINFKTNIVTIDEDGIYRMDYQKITMPLIKAVQEQQEMIDFLKKTIEDLKKNLERLEQLILDKK